MKTAIVFYAKTKKGIDYGIKSIHNNEYDAQKELKNVYKEAIDYFNKKGVASKRVLEINSCSIETTNYTFLAKIVPIEL